MGLLGKTLSLIVVLEVLMSFRPSVGLAQRALIEPTVATIFADLSLTGLTDKSSGVYTDLQMVLAKALRDNRRDFLDMNGEVRSASDIQSEFSAYCADGDFADRVFWVKKSENSLLLQFSCVKDGEQPRLQERLYSALVVNPPGFEAWRLVELKMLAADLEPEAEFRFKPASGSGSAITRATIAISGAVLMSASAARKQFPGGPDKVYHAVATSLIASGSATYLNMVEEMSPERAALAGGALSLLIGAAKETADPYIGGNRSRQDMKANLLGGAIGSLTVYLSFKFR